MKTQELILSKNLQIDEDAKSIITLAENGRYSYFDYSKEIIQEIVGEDCKELTQRKAFCLAQALFPKHLICGGLFDSFLMFKIKNGKRVDPPEYCYNNINCFLNNDNKSKVNYLADEIKDLLKSNGITWHESWNKVFTFKLEGKK